MKISMIMSKPAPPLINLKSGREVNLNNIFNPARRQKEKVIIVMGATGTGKSRLSIDLATQFPAEIINSDKMQIYEGLEVITNKISEEERQGIPHHLLGISSPFLDFSLAKFCDKASRAVDSIISRDRLPIIVGGSNSYIETLVENNPLFRSKYECCFLWVDVSMPVLHSFVSNRVDRMIEKGMIEEARNFFDPNADYSRGIRTAIGVSEFDKYFRNKTETFLREAIDKTKENTCKLATRQLGKIHRLQNVKGWKIHRLDATQVLRETGKESDEKWKKVVSGPSGKIVHHFLSNFTAPIPMTFMRKEALAASY